MEFLSKTVRSSSTELYVCFYLKYEPKFLCNLKVALIDLVNVNKAYKCMLNVIKIKLSDFFVGMGRFLKDT